MDLNCDLGEGMADDAALFPLITSANIACGGHAGDEHSMLASCRAAVAAGVAVGAHPSYPDREGFGRAPLELPAAQLIAEVARQLAALAAAAAHAGTRVSYVKPHGALYNRIAVDEAEAASVVAAVADVDPRMPLLGPPDSAIERAARKAGLPFFREAFPDRGYLADGRLVPRASPGAVIADPVLVAGRAVEIATAGRIRSIGGEWVPVAADSLCLHGDTPGAAENARAVRAALTDAGVDLGAFA
ncbi:5-oxoprolinase subunit PxpA [Rathayibacter sp. YIM 133350]|uniref:LamB/YcsF family protein n=1 Tax=Rathayibacter sp. YIM 133350 TaxID=3131992 RepID=UPI00307F701F